MRINTYTSLWTKHITQFMHSVVRLGLRQTRVGCPAARALWSESACRSVWMSDPDDPLPTCIRRHRLHHTGQQRHRTSSQRLEVSHNNATAQERNYASIKNNIIAYFPLQHGMSHEQWAMLKVHSAMEHHNTMSLLVQSVTLRIGATTLALDLTEIHELIPVTSIHHQALKVWDVVQLSLDLR